MTQVFVAVLVVRISSAKLTPLNVDLVSISSAKLTPLNVNLVSILSAKLTPLNVDLVSNIRTENMVRRGMTMMNDDDEENSGKRGRGVRKRWKN